MGDSPEEAAALALEFTRTLTSRDYDRAWGMLAPEYQARVTRLDSDRRVRDVEWGRP